ncbi:MAG: hypothetical protein HC824_16110, partial [Synechococcales cyanobacterium RM1_1_8]|nr:hypothetical protein [Synechococcales cyanobacterium RM1_1_8]
VPGQRLAPQGQSPPALPTPSIPTPSPWRHQGLKGLAILGWTLAGLAAIDLAINLLFAYPKDPNQPASSLATYFNYGRSTEGKLVQLLGASDAQSSPLAQAGWLTPEALASHPSRPARNGAPSIALYGMSFTDQIGKALGEIDPDLGLRAIAAPSGGPSYALAAYSADQAQWERSPSGQPAQPEVVILGILAHSVKSLQSLTGATWLFESPSAYTYPRYRLQNGQLTAIPPLVESLAKLRSTLADPAQGQAYRAQLAQEDAFYHPLLFQASPLDASSTLRLLRRSLAQRHQAQVEARIHDPQAGFIDPATNQLLAALVTDFAQQARDRNQLPIVLLIDSQNYDDHLLQVLQPSLSASNIPYLSTNSLAQASDPRSYVADGHFTAENNRAIAQSLLEIIDSELNNLETSNSGMNNSDQSNRLLQTQPKTQTQPKS